MHNLAPWDGSWLAYLPGEVASFRYLLLSLGLLWAFLQTRRHALWSLLGGVLFVELALVFWALSLQRPYGFLVDPQATAAMADAAVTAAADAPRSLLTSLEPAPGWRSWLAGRGVPLWLVLQIPLVVPAVVLPGLAALALVLARSRSDGLIAMTLLLLGLTGDLDALRGVGFLSGLWAHPTLAVVLLVGIVVVGGLAGRRRLRWSLAGVAAGLALALLLAPGATTPIRPASVCQLLVFDQGVWLALGCWGTWRRRDHVALSLVAVGAAALVLYSLLAGRGPDPWLGQAYYRTGLIFASVPAVSWLIPGLGERLRLVPWLRLYDRQGLGLAALVLALAPLSFPAWWEPMKLDATAAGSREELSHFLEDTLAWIASNTESGDVFIAPGEYASWVSVAAGRQVLRASNLRVAPDDAIRLQVEGRIMRGRPLPAWATRYRVRYILCPPEGPGLEKALSLPDLLRRPGYRLRFTDSRGLAVVEIEPRAGSEALPAARATGLARTARDERERRARSCVALQAL